MIGAVRELKPIQMTDRGRIVGKRGISAVADLKRSIAERQAKRARSRMESAGMDMDFELLDMPAVSKGTVLLVSIVFERGRACYFSLGEIRKRAERVADEACRDMARFLKSSAAVDERLADQLLIPLAFCEGESAFRTPVVTQHFVTNAEVVRLFWPATVDAGPVGNESEVRIRGQAPSPRHGD